HAVRSPEIKLLWDLVVFVNDPSAGAGELHSAVDDGSEDRLQVQARADGLADLPKGFQFFYRAHQLVCAGLQLLKQADILYGDDRLVGERRDQLNLRVGEGSDDGALNDDHSNESALSEHGNSQDRSETAPHLDFQPLQFVCRVSEDVWDVK